MKIAALCAFALIATAGSAHAQFYNSNRSNNYGTSTYGTGSNPNSHYVAPHIQNNGGYVGGHYQTNPNNTTLDNYGTRGNVNPYTGQIGTRRPY